MAAQRENGLTCLVELNCLPLLIKCHSSRSSLLCSSTYTKGVSRWYNFLGIALDRARSTTLTTIVAVQRTMSRNRIYTWIRKDELKRKACAKHTDESDYDRCPLIDLFQPGDTFTGWSRWGDQVSNKFVINYLIRPNLRKRVAENTKTILQSG